MINPEQLLAMARDKLAKLLTEQQTWVRACLVDNPSTSWIPSLAVLTLDAQGDEELVLHALAVDFNEDHEKRPLLRRLGADLFERKGVPICAVLTAEAWQSSRRAGTSPAVPHCEPRHDPARREVISAAAATVDLQQQWLSTLEVTRGPGDLLVPGDWGEVQQTGVKANLLAVFFAGFILAARARFGEPPEQAPAPPP